MTRISWLKKIWNGRSRGISTVLGTVFLTLVVFAISTNVFLWSLSRNAEYTLAVKEENQKTTDRLSENVIASGASYSVSEEDVTIKVTVKNAGSVAIQIINLWVFDTAQQKYTNEPVDLSLNPGNASQQILTVALSGANKSDDLVSWFVTARGNTVPLETEKGVIIAQVSQGIGSVSMDFASFRYYNVSKVGSSYILENYTCGAEGFEVPAAEHIAFEVFLTNYDEPEKREIKLLSGSILWAIFPVMGAQPRCAGWHIVNVYGNGTITPAYTTVTLAYGETAKVVFASETDVNREGFNPSSATDWYQQNKGSAAVNLMLVGKIGTSTYGQNVPFVSIYFAE